MVTPPPPPPVQNTGVEGLAELPQSCRLGNTPPHDASMCNYTSIYMRMYICIYICVYVYAYMYIRIRMYTDINV